MTKLKNCLLNPRDNQTGPMFTEHSGPTPPNFPFVTCNLDGYAVVPIENYKAGKKALEALGLPEPIMPKPLTPEELLTIEKMT